MMKSIIKWIKDEWLSIKRAWKYGDGDDDAYILQKIKRCGPKETASKRLMNQVFGEMERRKAERKQEAENVSEEDVDEEWKEMEARIIERIKKYGRAESEFKRKWRKAMEEYKKGDQGSKDRGNKMKIDYPECFKKLYDE